MRRALRVIAWSLGGVLLLVALLGAVLLIVGNTAAGRVWLERTTAKLTDGHVRIAALSGSFPAALDVGQLQLSDARGPWLTAEGIALRWSPLALLVHHLRIDELRISRLDIERRPAPEGAQQSTGGASLPRIDIRQLSIATLELGPQLAGSRARLTLAGTAHLLSLEDAAARITARRTDGAGGDYELSVSFDPQHLQASLKLAEPAGGTLENLLQCPQLGALSVVASLDGPRSAARLQLDARAGGLSAGVHGSVDLTQRAAELAYRLNAPAMTLRPGLAWQRLAITGDWRGTLSAARAAGLIEIAGLQIPGGAGLTSLTATLGADQGVLSVRAALEGLLLPGPQPRLLAGSPLRIEATLQLTGSGRPLRLSADHRLFTLRAHAITAGAQRASFDLRLPDLAPFAALAGQEVRGSAELRGTLEQKSATTRLDLEGNTQLPGGTTVPARLLGGASRLQLQASLTDRELDIESLTLSARRLSVSARGSVERGPAGAAPVRAVHVRYQAGVTDLSALSAALAGTLKATGRVDGPINSLAAQVQLTSSLSVRGSPRQTLQASLEARGLPSRPSATLKARGALAGAPLEVDASLERSAARTLHLVVQRADWRSAHLEGDLTTAADMTPGHGGLRLRVDRLADMQPLLGMQIAGRIAASLALRPADHHTYAQLRVDAENVVAANLSANAQLTASGPSDALSLHLRAQSPDLAGERASLDVAAQLDLAARELALHRLEARYHGQSLHLLAPARLSFAAGVALSPLRLGLQRAVLELDGRLSPQLDARASVHGIDAALVSAFAPQVLAEGSFDAEAQLRGDPAAPAGVVTVNAAGLRLASSAARDLHAVDVHATAHLEEHAARVDARLSAGEQSQLALSGTAPLDAAGALSLKLAGRIDTALANPMLEARGERVAGELVINASVTGTARAPEIGGSVDIRNGEFRDYVRGLHLAAISGHLVGSRGTLRIAALSARAAPGELSVSGTIGVLEPKLPIELELTAKNAQPITSAILTTNLDADVVVKGTLRERLDVSGNVDLHRTVIGIPNALPPDVAVLDVRRPGQAPPPPPEHRLVIALDLKLHAPREILLQGRGLDAELGGDLHIGGTTDRARVSGGFEMLRGRFTLASTTLTFTKGEVSFNGAGLGGEIDPTLDFTAQATTTDGTTSKLHITGFVDHPQFELSSTPSLPQDEILARLLFGVPASQLTALQLAQIGAALASLSGVGGSGPNPLVRMQKALGLDRLSVGGGTSTNGTQSSGASVEAGRYVSSRVYVGAKQSTTGFTQVEVDVDLSKHLKLQTRLGNGTATTQGTTPENDPGSSIGLSYQFEY